MINKIICFDARKLNKQDATINIVCSLEYEYLLITDKQFDELKLPKKMKLIVEMDRFRLIGEPHSLIVMSSNFDTLKKAQEEGYECALYSYISNEKEMHQLWQNGKRYSFLIVDFKDETNIPLELLIAQLQKEKTVILKIVRTAKDADVAMKVMEKGSEGIVLSSTDVEEILKLNKYIQLEKCGKVNLVSATVTSVQHIEMGMRACVDITDIMNKNEGMIIGSTSSGGLVISSETHYLPYMLTRPFRVNAGAVHSYVFLNRNKTKYLSELKSGSVIMIVDTQGNTRVASVGRMKLERRPLLKIVAKVGNIEISTIVQDDWHIRIFGSNGSVMNASNIKPGDKLLAYVCESGRHVGVKIDEKIIEI